MDWKVIISKGYIGICIRVLLVCSTGEGKGKPWLRSEARKPCAIAHPWAPYDLSRSSTHPLFLSGSLSGVEDEQGHVGRSLWPSSIDHVIVINA